MYKVWQNCKKIKIIIKNKKEVKSMRKEEQWGHEVQIGGKMTFEDDWA